jgi:2-polyprenyl-6-methoxyphenol hydroxylase-like FAD-dependent oxidoreductase
MMTKLELYMAERQAGAAVALTADEAINGLDAEAIVIGAGFAGALIALLLARQGRSTLVIDPHAVHPGDFRCEKLSRDQAQLIVELRVGQAFGLAADGDPADLTKRGFAYDEMVNGLRALWPEDVTQIVGKAVSIVPSPHRSRVTLADGRTLAAKLVVLATGLGERLRGDLGLKRRVMSPAHSVGLGLTLEAPAAQRDALIGLVQPGERLGDGVGYASFFPAGSGVRLNLFLYDPPQSERVARFRTDPLGELVRALPSLKTKLAGVRVVSPVQMRVTDLYAIDQPARDGVVLIGDARRTSCPASGTGVTRILQDAKLLNALYLPRWFSADKIDAEQIGGFYGEPSLTALDRTAHRRSLNGRRSATRKSLYWRARRWAQGLRAGLSGTSGAATPDPIQAGRVVVRSAQEILATLDADGRLDAMPFMPEMIPYIGREMQVSRRIERTCVEGAGNLRGLARTVALEGARCDGALHDGCQRGCLIYWKTDWLRPADRSMEIDPAAEAAALARLAALPTRVGEAYSCQSTQLTAASYSLPNLHLRQLVREVRLGDLHLTGLGRILFRAVANRVRKAMGLAELGLIVGQASKPSKGDLGLKPGDWVRIKSEGELRAALDATSRNRGLTFEPEMTRYVGGAYRVSQVVERIIDEQKGKMLRLDRTVILDQVVCQGLCNKACPRKNPLFWREAWLERIEAPSTSR